MARGRVYETGVGWRDIQDGDLPASGVTPGTYGDATHVSVPTVNSEGLITGITTAAITGSGVTSLNSLVGALSIAAGTNISVASGGSTITISGTTPASGYGTQFDGMVVPIGTCNIATWSSFNPGANVAWACRVVIPRTGTLNNLSVLIFTSGGNIDVGVYDTAATTRNLLYHTGTIASPGTGWRNVGNPGLSVTVNDVYDFVVVGSSASFAIGRGGSPSTVAYTLPTGFLPGGGGTPWTGWDSTLGGTLLPATLAESSMNPQAACSIIATVT